MARETKGTTTESQTPRLLTQKAAAAYVGVSTPTFAKWVMEGIFPGSAGRTKMWDRKAIDLAIDKMSGIKSTPEPVVDEWAIWEKQYEADKAERARLAAQTEDNSFAAWKTKNEAKKEREAKLLVQPKASPRTR
jgi:hypothetical protein